MTDDLSADIDQMVNRGLSVGLFTLSRRPGWHCQLNDDKGIRFTNGEGLTMTEAFELARQKMEKLWVTE